MNKIYIPILIINLFLTGCATKRLVQIPNYPPQKITLTVTGYCECKICCGWKRNWRFQPVYAYGPSAGKPKRSTYSLWYKKLVKGTIAADTKIFPYGTIIQVPGYGIGRVEGYRRCY